MARGIGGEDGPSLWMFIAVVLVWGQIKGWFSWGKDKLDGNLANLVQPETTEQIRKMEAKVKSTPYKVTNLKHSLDYYQQIADAQYKEMNTWGNTDEDALIAQVQPLNKDELIAVFKCFGVRDSDYTTLGLLATGTGNLFDFYNEILEDSTFGGNDRTNMWNIWKVTGLWTKTW